MRRNAGFAFVVLLSMMLFAFPVGARAASDGYSLLKQTETADDRVSFSGTVTSLVYDRDNTTATVARIDHRNPSEWRLWYVAPADAYGRLILSNESVAYQYEPSTGKVFSNDWASLSPFAATLDLDRIRRNYAIQAGAAASVAGRQARTLSLVSNYSHTLVLRLWVDTATGLTLRRETYRADGTIATKTSFDNIRYVKDLPNELFKMSVPAGMTLVPGPEYGKSTTDFNSLTTGLPFKALAPMTLPEGFTFEKGSTETRGGVENLQLVYSDGLRNISLFENQTGRFPVFDGPAPRSMAVGKSDGKYTSVGGQTLLSWNASGLNITLVSDLALAPKELAHIGASVKP